MNIKSQVLQQVQRDLLPLLYDKDNGIYGEILLRCTLTYNNKIPAAIGVGLDYKALCIRLFLNERYLEMEEKERILALKHEALHIICGHLLKSASISMPNAAMANVAMDLEINQYLKQDDYLHSRGWLILSKIPELSTLDSFQPAQHYYNYLTALTEQEQEQMGGPMDSHEGLGEYDDSKSGGEAGDQSEQLGKAITQDVVSRSKDAAMRAGRGLGGLEAAIDELLKSKLDWKQILRRFRANTKSRLTKLTRSKRNRRYGIRVSGRKYLKKWNVLVALDTSGSMGMDLIQEVLAEVYSMAEDGTVVDLVQFDGDVRDFKLGLEQKDVKKLTVKGGGGTLFQPVIDWAVKNGPALGRDWDCVVCLTDGGLCDGDSLVDKLKKPTLWVCPDNYGCSANFGQELRVKLENA